MMAYGLDDDDDAFKPGFLESDWAGLGWAGLDRCMAWAWACFPYWVLGGGRHGGFNGNMDTRFLAF
jgi:hypothetical protein